MTGGYLTATDSEIRVTGMKRILWLAIFIVMSVGVSTGFGQEVADLMKQAREAYVDEKYEDALELYQMVLELDPKHPQAQFFVKNLKMRQAGGEAGLKKRLEGIIVEEVEFRDADLGACLEFLQQKAKEIGKLDINFVNQAGDAKDQGITLSLKNLPMTVVLDYVGRMADVEIVYEAHAVVVRPISTKSGEGEESQSAK